MPDRPTLTFKAVTVHFIYSFVLRSADRIVIRPSEDLAQLNDSIFTIESGPVRKKGIQPHLQLTSEARHFEYHVAERHEIVDPEMDIRVPCEVRRTIRLFPTGGTCTIAVTIRQQTERPLGREDVLRMFSLVHDDPDFTFEWDANAFVPELFEAALTAICSKDGKLRWLDKEYVKKQDPWVVTVLEVIGPAADELLTGSTIDTDPARTKMLYIRRYEEELAQILFRSIAKDFLLEPAYLSAPSAVGVPGLYSVNLDARLNVHLSHRSMLCVCRDANESPASYFVPSLLDMCELARSRWHTLVILNKEIDRTLFNLRNTIEDEAGDPRLRREIMQIREWLAVSMDDQLMYTVAGDALSRIYHIYRDWLRLDSLKELLFQKVDLLDRLYQDVVALRYRSPFSEIIVDTDFPE
jgi:hypothetical protein